MASTTIQDIDANTINTNNSFTSGTMDSIVICDSIKYYRNMADLIDISCFLFGE